MALNHSPRIVTNALVLCLDAANTKSYPGSGSTWFDISGNGNHFTLYNGIGFLDGAIVFDGFNDFAASTNTINLSSYDYIVCEIWFRLAGGPSSMLIEHSADWNSNSGAWGLSVNSDGNSFSSGMHHTNHNGVAVRNYLHSPPAIQTAGFVWNTHVNIFSKVSDSTGRLTYCDGNLVNFVTGPGYPTSTSTSSGSFGNYTLYLGSRGGSSGWYSGRISVVKIYGFKFSNTDIQQNFQAHRGRYSI